MGKSSINWPISMAMLNNQRVPSGENNQTYLPEISGECVWQIPNQIGGHDF